MGDSNKGIFDNAVNTIELFGKTFEVSSVVVLGLKIAGVATLGFASVLSTGVVPIVVASVVGGATLTKYAVDKYIDHKPAEQKPDDLLKPVSKRIPQESGHLTTNEILARLERSGDLSIFNKIAENLAKLGFSGKDKFIEPSKSRALAQQKTPSLPPK
jgi:hypothetical protein